jgi:hypothetical protein
LLIGTSAFSLDTQAGLMMAGLALDAAPAGTLDPGLHKRAEVLPRKLAWA